MARVRKELSADEDYNLLTSENAPSIYLSPDAPDEYALAPFAFDAFAGRAVTVVIWVEEEEHRPAAFYAEELVDGDTLDSYDGATVVGYARPREVFDVSVIKNGKLETLVLSGTTLYSGTRRF